MQGFRVLVLLGLLACSHATINHGLAEITTLASTVAITSSAPETTLPTLIGSWGPATYDGTQTTSFNYHLNFTIASGANVVPDTVQATLTNGNDVLVSLCVASCTGTLCVCANQFNTPYFTLVGTYSLSLTVSTNTYQIKTLSQSDLSALPAGANWNSVVISAKYNAPSLLNPFVIPASQGLECGNTAGDCNFYYNVTVNPPSLSTVGAIYTSSIPASGVVWVLSELSNAFGYCDPTSFKSKVWYVTDVTGSPARARYPFTITGNTGSFPGVLPTGAVLTPVGATITNGGHTFSTSLPSIDTVTATGGTADQDAPTCTAAQFSSNMVSTTNSGVPVTITIACDDGGGNGVFKSGVFLQLTRSGADPVTFPVIADSSNMGAFTIPPYTTGTLSIVGVFAIDKAGNAALYGSCGGVPGYGTLCGQGSSASTVAFPILGSLLTIVMLSWF